MITDVNISNALLIDGWMSEQELTWLAQQASKIANGKIVEIGTYLGRSARAMADNLQIGSNITCVDPYRKYDDPVIKIYNGLDADTLYWSAQNNVKGRGNSAVSFMRRASTEAALKFKDQTIDMVFIDGEHTYNSVKADINAWLPKIKPGGLICGHDYGVYPGVKLAVEACLMIDEVYFPAGSIWAYKLGGQS